MLAQVLSLPVADEPLYLKPEKEMQPRRRQIDADKLLHRKFAAVPADAWSRVIVPDTRLLFRFSALTFNAHRIHYDRPYAMDEEGYPGLVVHGPLTAILLLKLARQNISREVLAFSFRSQAPLFDLAPFRLVATPVESRVELEAQGPDAMTAMIATAEFAD